MTIARSLLVDRSGVGLYHCISRCVRRARLCGDEFDHRKDWIRDRLRLLTGAFAIDVAAYAVMSNHLHVVIRTDPDRVKEWSNLEVARRWCILYPRDVRVRSGISKNHARGDATTEQSVLEESIAALACDRERIAVLRNRLSDLSWFMKCLKEPIARRANREDDCRGTFWEGRFRSIALLDDTAALACMVYVDLNVIRAMLATTPEQSDHTSVQDRIHVRQLYEKLAGRRARASRRAPSLLAGIRSIPTNAEDGIWLAPIQQGTNEARPGMFRMTLDDYLTIVDTTARIARPDKPGVMPPSLPPILNRLGIDLDRWQATMSSTRDHVGTAVGKLECRIAEARRRGMKWIVSPLDVSRDTAARTD